MKQTVKGIALLLALVCLNVRGAPTFLQIEGIDGEVRVDRYEDWIDIWSLHFDVGRPERGAPPQLSELSVVKKLDKASPLLFQQATTGNMIPVLVIDFFRNGVSEPRHLRIRLSDVFVTGYSIEQKDSDGLEVISLFFEEIELEQTQYDKHQMPVGTKRVHYNLVTRRGGTVTDGPPPVGANTPPTVSAIPDQALAVNSSVELSVTVGDEQTAAQFLNVTAESSNPALVPAANIVLGGTGSNRTLTLAPAANTFGSSTITVLVSDGELSASTSFLLTVEQPDEPFISNIDDVTIGEGETAFVPFTIAHPTADVNTLLVTGTSSDEQLLPAANIQFTGTGPNRIAELTAAPGRTGQTAVAVTVSDGAESKTMTFHLTVQATAPPIAILAPDRIEGVAGSPLAVTGLALSDPAAGATPVQLTITAPSALLSVNATVPGGLAAAQIQGNDTAAVTISAPLSAINATLAAPNGLLYLRAGSGSGEIALEAARSGTASATIEIYLFESGIALWRARHFAAEDLSDPEKEATVWGDLANPTGDGLVNLLKYALGLSPLETYPSSNLPHVSWIEEEDQLYFGFTIVRRTDDPSLECVPELSFDLENWTSGAAVFEEQATLPVGDGLEQVAYRHLVDEEEDARRFVRLRVTHSPENTD